MIELVLMRHEKRDLNYPRFFTCLTEEGRINSIKLSNKLKDLKINLIFSSPFERAIQTIIPFCIMQNQMINIDNSLYESIDNKIFIDEKIYDQNSIRNVYKQWINNDYKSLLSSENFTFCKDKKIKFLENEGSVYDRAYLFMEYLLREYSNNDIKILIISHEGLLKNLEKLR